MNVILIAGGAFWLIAAAIVVGIAVVSVGWVLV